MSILGKIKTISCYKPEGAFYVFPKCSDLFGLKTPSGKIIKSSSDFAEYLLEDFNVAVVPGIAFGLDEYFRISYATSIKDIEQACLRIEKAFNQLV